MKFSSILNPEIPLRSFSDGILSYGNLIQKSNDCSQCQLFTISDRIEEIICKPCRIQQSLRQSQHYVDTNVGDIIEHSQKVSYLSYVLAKKLELSQTELLYTKLAALYHDIGKTKIPDQIINKKGKLDKEEWRIMKSHSNIGFQILMRDKHLRKIAQYVKYHHERIDGRGYPNGLKGDQIPIISRIISVVDAYDAMTSDRPYRKSLSKTQAIDELVMNSGTQFDKNIVKVFINNVLN